MLYDTCTPAVLYVEDDEATAWMFEAIAREHKYALNTIVATNGYMAVRVLNKCSPFQDAHTPDLIVLDVDLPGMNGFRIFKEIQETGQIALIPVVFFTATDHPAFRDFALEMGATACIHKPADPAGFSIAIERICAFVSAEKSAAFHGHVFTA